MWSRRIFMVEGEEIRRMYLNNILSLYNNDFNFILYKEDKEIGTINNINIHEYNNDILNAKIDYIQQNLPYDIIYLK